MSRSSIWIIGLITEVRTDSIMQQMVISADKQVKEMRQSVDLLKNESKKLEVLLDISKLDGRESVWRVRFGRSNCLFLIPRICRAIGVRKVVFLSGYLLHFSESKSLWFYGYDLVKYFAQNLCRLALCCRNEQSLLKRSWRGAGQSWSKDEVFFWVIFRFFSLSTKTNRTDRVQCFASEIPAANCGVWWIRSTRLKVQHDVSFNFLIPSLISILFFPFVSWWPRIVQSCDDF